MNIFKSIVNSPTVINNVHESSYRVYHILEQVLKMVKRGDCPETIVEVVEYLRGFPEKIDETVKHDTDKYTHEEEDWRRWV